MASFHVKRSVIADEPELHQWKGARSTKWVVPPDGTSVLEIQTTHTPEVFKDVPDDKNHLRPPPHWHWYQDEYFHIKQGRYLFTLEGKEMAVSANDPQPVTVPATARHTFKVDPTSPGPCVIEISTKMSPFNRGEEPDAVGASERFFRNIYGYLEDCFEQNASPSVPQLFLMLHDAEISAAFPGPALVAQWASWTFGLVVGKVIGQYVLGYSSSYAEYYDPDKRALAMKKRESKKAR